MSIGYDGRIRPGERRSPATEFKPGEHWRPPQVFREKAWLEAEYVAGGRSCEDIAGQFGVTPAAITFWLRRHGIPRRTIAQVRAAKHWGAAGDRNPMFGKRGAEVPSWRGGVTPERQALYSSPEWAEAVKAVWQRDRGTCRRCGAKPNGKGEFAIHHIVSFAVRELRTDLTNLVLLCAKCHRFVHSRKNAAREWISDGDGGEAYGNERSPGE